MATGTLAPPVSPAVPSLLSLAISCAAADLSNLTLNQLDLVPAELLCDILSATAKRSALTRAILAMWIRPIKETIPIDGVMSSHQRCLLSSLIQLSLSNCNDLNAALFEALATQFHPSLLSLDLSRCYALPDIDALEAHPCLKTIQTLSLDRCRKFTTQSVAVLANMDSLTSLNLSGTGIRDPAILTLASSFPNLTHFNVNGCLVGIGLAEFCTRLSTVRPIRDLRLSSTLFKNPELEYLHLFHDTLTCLHVSFKPNITDAGLSGLQHLHKLTELDLSRNVGVGDPSVCSLINLHQLRTLSISRIDVSDISLATVATLSNLTFLDIGYNSQLTSLGCMQLCTLVNLETLYIPFVSVGDDWIFTCIPHLSKLRALKINGCKNIHDNSILALRQAACADTLEQLDLGSLSITNACLPHLISPRVDGEERTPIPNAPISRSDDEKKQELIAQSLADPSFSHLPFGKRISIWDSASSTPLATFSASTSQWSRPTSIAHQVEQVDPFPKLFRIGIWSSSCTAHAISRACDGSWMEDTRMATTHGTHILVRKGHQSTDTNSQE